MLKPQALTSCSTVAAGRGPKGSLPSQLLSDPCQLRRAEPGLTPELPAAAHKPLCWAKAEPGRAACVKRDAGAGPGWMEPEPPAVVWCRPQTEAWSVAELLAGPVVGPQPWSTATRPLESLPPPPAGTQTAGSTFSDP